MGTKKCAKLNTVDGRDALLFESSAIVRFPELAQHADEAVQLCRMVEVMFRDPKQIGVKFLGSVCFKDMAAEYAKDTYIEPAMDQITAARPDAVLIAGWNSPDHSRRLPDIVNALGTLTSAYIEANRIATAI